MMVALVMEREAARVGACEYLCVHVCTCECACVCVCACACPRLSKPALPGEALYQIACPLSEPAVQD